MRDRRDRGWVRDRSESDITKRDGSPGLYEYTRTSGLSGLSMMMSETGTNTHAMI